MEMPSMQKQTTESISTIRISKKNLEQTISERMQWSGKEKDEWKLWQLIQEIAYIMHDLLKNAMNKDCGRLSGGSCWDPLIKHRGTGEEHESFSVLADVISKSKKSEKDQTSYEAIKDVVFEVRHGMQGWGLGLVEIETGLVDEKGELMRSTEDVPNLWNIQGILHPRQYSGSAMVEIMDLPWERNKNDRIKKTIRPFNDIETAILLEEDYVEWEKWNRLGNEWSPERRKRSGRYEIPKGLNIFVPVAVLDVIKFEENFKGKGFPLRPKDKPDRDGVVIFSEFS